VVARASVEEASKPRFLPDSAAEERRFLIQFLPMSRRTIQADGLPLFYRHYWHPIFTAWRAANRRVVVRYHPEDLSRIFVSADGKEYIEASFADLRRGRISLWEQQAVLKHLRSQGKSHVKEKAIFNSDRRTTQHRRGGDSEAAIGRQTWKGRGDLAFPGDRAVQSAGKILLIANAGCRLQQAASNLSRRATVN
jgi:hypothetical protein